MSRKYLSKATQFFLGAVEYHRANQAKPGVQITPELRHIDYGVIATAVSNGVCASQSVLSGIASLINGSLATASVATFATPRNVVAAWTNTAVCTVVGTDEYGSIVTESSASGTSMTGKKAFKTITAVTFNADVTGATVGSGVVIGLPVRVDLNGLLVMLMDSAATTVTFAAAVTTDPATATTGDVRGTVVFASAPNASRAYALLVKIADPSSKLGSYGILQYGSTDSV